MNTAASIPHARAKARGLLLGGALGDALGAAFEGQRNVDGAALLAREQATDQLRYTDDTAQAFTLALHLVKRLGYTPVAQDALADQFARAWQQEPWRGYGAGARQVLGRILAGDPWADAAQASFAGGGSYGNGAAMRVAPIALVATGLEHAALLARDTAVVTHAHQQGQAGAVLQACAAFLALRSDLLRPLDREDFLDQLSHTIRSASWQGRLDSIRALSQDASPSYAAARLGNGVAAADSVPLAIQAFLQHPDQPAEAVRYAIRAGGDTDTIASMAGALAGARNGVDRIPPAWTERLENAQQLRDIADRLAPRITSERPTRPGNPASVGDRTASRRDRPALLPRRSSTASAATVPRMLGTPPSTIPSRYGTVMAVQADEHAEDPVTRMEILDAITAAFASPPATKDQIVAAAEDSRSRSDLVALLSQLPNSTFSDVRDLWSHLPDVPVDVT